MLVPNAASLTVSLQAPVSQYSVYVMARYAPWHVVVLQDRSIRCSCVLPFILASLGQCSDFYFLLFARHLDIKSRSGEKCCSDTVYISPSCPFPCRAMCSCDTVPALQTFCFHRFSSQELQGSLKASLFVVMEVLLLCTDLAFHVVMLLASLPRWQGIGYTNIWEPHLPSTWGISAVQSSAHAQAGSVAGKQH